eukprot:Gb_30110 [translate_table: standard]
MPRRHYEEEEEQIEEEYQEANGRNSLKRKSRWAVSEFNDEDEDEEEEKNTRRKKYRKNISQFIDDTAEDASDEEEEEEEGDEEDFINDNEGADLELEDQDDDHRRCRRQRPSAFLQEEEDEDVGDIERMIAEKYGGTLEYDGDQYEDEGGEATAMEQQARLPSARDQKLWIVKCAIGQEREAAVCLWQKYFDLRSRGTELKITSAVALDYLQGYLYVEAEKEAHVKEACKGIRIIYSSNVKVVPIKEMTDVLSVECKKAPTLSNDMWVRVKSGTYKGDLAKLIDMDEIKQTVTIKLIPRLDLRAVRDKMLAKESEKKSGPPDQKGKSKSKIATPPSRFIDMDQVKALGIPIFMHKDKYTGHYFQLINGEKLKDGYIYKTMSMKSVNSQNVQPSIVEIQRFQNHEDLDAAGLMNSTLQKKREFVKGDTIIIVAGELKDLIGRVEKVEDDIVHIKSKMEGLEHETLMCKTKDIRKFFKTGNHVKVVNGVHRGATGMVVKVEGDVVVIVSDTMHEEFQVFADDVVESNEDTSALTKLGDSCYELYDLVLLDQMNFGVIVHVEVDGCHVLGAIPEKPHAATVKLRDIKKKLFDRYSKASDQRGNTIALKDVVKIVEGPSSGKQGTVEHIHRGMIFIHDSQHPYNGGYICARSQSCLAFGGDNSNRPAGTKTSSLGSRTNFNQPPPQGTLSRRPPRPITGPGGVGRGRTGPSQGENLVNGKIVKMRVGQYKGYRGRVVGVQGQLVRIELESQMKVVTVPRNQIAEPANAIDISNESPMHHSTCPTPHHPFMGTPVHDGMRTPITDPTWNPDYTNLTTPSPMTRTDNSPWGYRPSTRPSPYRTPTCSGARKPSTSSAAQGTPSSGPRCPPTPRNHPSTPNTNTRTNTPRSNSGGLPPTTRGHPIPTADTPYQSNYSPASTAPHRYANTPPTGLSPSTRCPPTPAGGPGEHQYATSSVPNSNSNSTLAEGAGLLPDIEVTLRTSGKEGAVGVVKEVLLDGTCKICIDSEMIMANASEIDIVPPNKTDRIKVISGESRGVTGKLIGVDTAEGIIKIDGTVDIKILPITALAKLTYRS